MIPEDLSISPSVVVFHWRILGRLLIWWVCKYRSAYQLVSRTIKPIILSVMKCWQKSIGLILLFFTSESEYMQFIPRPWDHLLISNFFIETARFKRHFIEVIIQRACSSIVFFTQQVNCSRISIVFVHENAEIQGYGAKHWQFRSLVSHTLFIQF